MSKKPVKHEEVKQESTVHLKVLADLFIPSQEPYLQGQTIEVNASTAAYLQSNHAGYFEVIPES